MQSRLLTLIAFVFLATSLVPGTSGAQPSAQGAPDPAKAGAPASPELRRHHAMQGLMEDMAQQMTLMREEIAKGTMSPEAERAMSSRMKRMSEMMSRMAGLMDRPAMKEPEASKQLEQMRKQMDEMKKAHSMPGDATKAGGAKR